LAIEKEEIEAFFITFAQFTNARSIYSALYDVKPKAQSERCAPYCALAIECIMGNYYTRWRPWVKGLSLDGGRADFSKKPLRHFL
jgi:hypothetical protein